MIRKMLLLGMSLGGLALVGCQADKEGINEKAFIEAKAGNDAATAYLATRATAMESDLERRRRFIDSVVGTYEGTATDMQGEEKPIRFIVTSSFPRLPESQHTRSLEELSYELSNLYLNVQVIEWSAINDHVEIAFGCVFPQVRPNIVDGAIHLMSEECKISYALYAAESGPNAQIPTSSQINRSLSRTLAGEVVDGKVTEISAFVGRKQSNLASKRAPLRVRRVNDQ